MARRATVFLAGGGSGGHIYPNLAIADRLAEMGGDSFEPHLLISDREVDRTIADAAGVRCTVLPAQPLRKGPGGVVRFMLSYRRSAAIVGAMLAEHQPAVVVATGGFVAAPAVAAAAKRGAATALVNLDAIPGRANQLMARRATAVFTAYNHQSLGEAQRAIGLPLRREVVQDASAAWARRRFELDPQRDTLLITAGSQGARSLNEMMIAFCDRLCDDHPLRQWQVLHLTGEPLPGEVRAAYERAGVPAKVLAFSHEMGAAWSAATLAISRAGASSVAEAWANHVPTLFFPYPWHRDGHQKLNAQPMVTAGGALVMEDRCEAGGNVSQLDQFMTPLMADGQTLERMRVNLGQRSLPDGAEAVARWVQEQVAVATV